MLEFQNFGVLPVSLMAGKSIDLLENIFSCHSLNLRYVNVFSKICIHFLRLHMAAASQRSPCCFWMDAVIDENKSPGGNTVDERT